MSEITIQQLLKNFGKAQKEQMTWFHLGEKYKPLRSMYSSVAYPKAYFDIALYNYRPHKQHSTLVTLFLKEKVVIPAHDKTNWVLRYWGILGHPAEKRLTQWLIKNLSNDDVFFDVGANVGFYTSLAELLGSQVYAFEANKSLVGYLQKSFGKKKNISLVDFAVSDKIGSATFYDASVMDNAGVSSLIKDAINGDSKKSVVKTVTLDHFIKDNKIPTILKLDIEGGEYKALLGSKELLQKYHPKVVMEVWSDTKGKKYSTQAVSFLKSLGYSAYRFDDRGNVIKNEVSDPVSIAGSFDKYSHLDNFLFLHK